MTKFVAGIDEAGRGPVLGPLVLAGVLVGEDKIQSLVDIGVKDSKRLSPKRRAELCDAIERLVKKIVYVEISPEEIDARADNGMNLNQLEAQKMVYIINDLRPALVYIDCPDVRPARFTEWVKSRVKHKSVEIVAMHHADERMPAVSAASILAKVRRDLRLVEIGRKLGEIGSGYPSDLRTRRYLEGVLRRSGSSGCMPKDVRSTWETIKNIGESIIPENRKQVEGKKLVSRGLKRVNQR